MKDSERIHLICERCGETFDVPYGSYRRYKEGHKTLCKQCLKIQRSIDRKAMFDNMTQDQRDAWQNKMQSSHKKLTEEEKKEFAKKCSEALKKSWKSKSVEYRKKHGEKVRNAINAMPDEDKLLWKQHLSISAKRSWSNLSIDERKAKMSSLFNGSKDYWENITDDELKRNHALVSEGLKRYFKNADPEELKKRWKNIGKKTRERWDNMSDEDRIKRMKIMWDACTPIGPSEKQLYDLLKNVPMIEDINFVHSFSTESIPYVHPEFFNVFGTKNPIGGEDNYPYHRWDFLIKGLNESILIDVDGSVHNVNPKCMVRSKNGKLFSFYENIKFLDSKRPYQIPPGYKAYVIKAYDDKIDDDTEVVPIGIGINESPMKFKTFLSLIILSMYSEKELNSAINIHTTS